MAAIKITELIPANPEDYTNPVTPLPEHLGTASVEFDQDDYDRPLTIVTITDGKYAGQYVYIWNEDGLPMISSQVDFNTGLDDRADNAALVAYALALHRNYERLLRAATWNLIGNTDFKTAIGKQAMRTA